MNKLITILLILCSVNILFSQEIDLNALPKFDCEYKKWSAFTKDTVIVVQPTIRSFSAENELNGFLSFLNNKYKIKSENQLTESDFNKSLFIVGKPSDFKKWKTFNLPIKSKKNGFEFNKTKFNGKQDAIWLNQNNRVAIIANDLSSLKTALETGQLGMDFVVLQNNQLTYFGNFSKEKQSKIEWSNLREVLKNNYTVQPKNIADFYISKAYKSEFELNKTNSDLNTHLQKFAEFYQIEIPKDKVNILIHNNSQEIMNMIGMWHLTCGGNTAGMNVRGELHCVGSNQDLVNHEMSHHVFNSNISPEMMNELLIEGIVERFTNHQNPELFRSRIQNISKNFDKINLESLFQKGNNFYNENSGLNYDLSGIWVQYFIDTYGMQNFKSFCKSQDKIAFIEKVSNGSFQKFNENFEAWLESQSKKL